MRGASPGRLWSQSDLRARAVSLVVLGVLTGLTIGLGTAAFDGARRTDSALDRLRAQTNASDAVVFATQSEVVDAGLERTRKRPEVDQLVRWGLGVRERRRRPEGVLFVPMDGVWLQTRLTGRSSSPVGCSILKLPTRSWCRTMYVADGSRRRGRRDTFPFTAMTRDGAFGEPASGPQLTMRVVGIVHTPLSYVFTGGVYLSPGFVTKYGETALVAENAMVQLRGADGDIGALRRDASSDVADGVPVLDFQVTGRRVTATTDVEGAMLRLMAAIVLLAGVAFVGQALARSAATIGTDASTLRALGMTRRELVASALRPHLVTSAVAVVITVLTAVVASRWFPVGLASTVDPSRGIQVNVALVTAAAVLAALVTHGTCRVW